MCLQERILLEPLTFFLGDLKTLDPLEIILLFDPARSTASKVLPRVTKSRTALDKSLRCSLVSSFRNAKFSRSIRILMVLLIVLSPISEMSPRSFFRRSVTIKVPADP